MRHYNRGFIPTPQHGVMSRAFLKARRILRDHVVFLRQCFRKRRHKDTAPCLMSGFSLIEILIVIAIIGVLTSVVMSSLRIARNRAADAGIQANIHNMQIEAQNYFDSNENFGTAGTDCTNPNSIFTDQTISRQLTSATTASGQPAVCANSSTKWVISVPLRNGNSWCADTTGIVKEAVADTVTISCP